MVAVTYLNTFEDLTINLALCALSPSPWNFLVLYKQTCGLLCYILYALKTKSCNKTTSYKSGNPQGCAKRRGQMRQVF